MKRVSAVLGTQALRRAAPIACARAMPALMAAAAAPSAPLLQPAMLGTRRFASTSLGEEAKNELSEEEAREDKAACPPTPAGWTLTRNDGETRFHMRKEHGNEVVECFCQLEVADPELVEKRVNQESNAPSEHFPFTVTVTKNGKTLDFTLTHMEGELVIDGMTHYASPTLARDFGAEGLNKKERFYQGPAMAELNSSLVQGMVSFLEARGIDDDFGAFVAQYSYWLEQTEYEMWLRKVVDFCN